MAEQNEEEERKRNCLDGFLVHFKDAEKVVEKNLRGKKSGDPAGILVSTLKKYISLTCGYDPFGENKKKTDAVYGEIKKLLSPEALKEYSETNKKLADAIIKAEDESFKNDFLIMTAYITSYAGESAATETLSFFYGEYLAERERERTDYFCSRERIFEEARPTGFKKLDEVLDGGVYTGLYVLGAPSSAGKTTFCIQLCDQIAASGTNVLFFSLEMSGEELLSKSISRLTFIHDRDVFKRNAKSERKLSSGIYRKKFTEEEWETVNRAAGYYASEIAPFKCVYESGGTYGAKEIENDVRNYIDVRGVKPVVFIDYLQILRPESEGMTDKQNTDRNVSSLRRMCRDLGITVFIISSFNRASYNQNAGMEAFKESGAIEYSADVVMTLQPEGVKNSSEQDKKAITENKEVYSSVRKMDVRPMKLTVLKNRRGKCGAEIKYNYNCIFGLFDEEEEDEEKNIYRKGNVY